MECNGPYYYLNIKSSDFVDRIRFFLQFCTILLNPREDVQFNTYNNITYILYIVRFDEKGSN